MFRQICHIVHGRLVWLKWKRRFRLDHRKVLLVLTGENEQIDGSLAELVWPGGKGNGGAGAAKCLRRAESTPEKLRCED